MDIYLTFTDQAKEVIHFYEEIFSVTCTDLTTFGDMPSSPDFSIPEEQKALVLNASLIIYGTRVMFSDTPEGMSAPVVIGNNVALVIQTTTPEETKQFFQQLSEGGEVTMPLEPTFWAKLYGTLTDRYGISWMVNLPLAED